MSIRVLVADDSEPIRKALKTFLRDRPEIVWVGEVPTMAELSKKCSELKPDIVLLDLHLAERGVTAHALKACLYEAKLLAMTFAADEYSEELAGRIGADTLVDKINLNEELVPTLLKLSQFKNATTELIVPPAAAVFENRSPDSSLNS
jgi:DNA-binding NarL/FixJ family response regulator